MSYLDLIRKRRDPKETPEIPPSDKPEAVQEIEGFEEVSGRIPAIPVVEPQLEPAATPDAARNLFDPASSQVRTVPTTSDRDEAVECFLVNVGFNPKAPSIRLEPYATGTWVEIVSPLVGRYRAEVLRDNGEKLWVFNLRLERETAIPGSWVVGPAAGPVEGETLDVYGRQPSGDA